MAASTSERKAAERAAKRQLGLVPMEVWTKPEHRPKVKQYVERLNKRTAPQEPVEQ